MRPRTPPPRGLRRPHDLQRQDFLVQLEQMTTAVQANPLPKDSHYKQIDEGMFGCP